MRVRVMVRWQAVAGEAARVRAGRVVVGLRVAVGMVAGRRTGLPVGTGLAVCGRPARQWVGAATAGVGTAATVAVGEGPVV